MKKHMGFKIRAMVVFASLVTMVACGSKNNSSDGGVAVAPYGLNGCTNCAGITPVEVLRLTSQGSSSMGGSILRMRLIGDAAQLQQIYNAGYSPVSAPTTLSIGISGDASIGEGLAVQNTFYSGSCLIPGGSAYSLSTVRLGEMYYGTLRGSSSSGYYAGYPSGIPMVQVEAVGPTTRLLLGVQQGVVNGSRMSMKIWILEGPGVAGNQVQCQDGVGYFTTN